MDMEVKGTRVLRPGEMDRLREVMGKPSNRVVFDCLLFTGLRYAELTQVWEDPSRFDPSVKCLKIDNRKPKAAERAGDYRVVYLSDRGVEAVRDFIQLNKKPSRYDLWLNNLKRWSHVAGMSPLGGMEDGTTSEQMGLEKVPNVWGISVKTTRKTWECWLFCAFPDRADLIADSMGHSLEVSKKHYRKWFGAFTADEKAKIMEYTAGWLS